MSLLRRSAESRSVSYQDLFGRGEDVSGLVGTSAQSGLRLAPLFAAVRLIADQFAAAPMHAYRTRPDGSRERVSPQPSLTASPGVAVSPYAWKHQMVASMLTRGNAVGLVTGTQAGWPSAIAWLNPDRCSVDESRGGADYYYDGRLMDPRTVVHVPAFVLPGSVWGLSPLQLFKLNLETGQVAQKAARDWFASGAAVPGGHLRNTSRTVDPDQADRYKSRFKAAVANRDVLVTGNDWEFSPIGIPADQAAFVEMMKLTATQIASVYGIPPEMIGGETGSSLTYATVEQNMLNFATLTMRPWFVRAEEALSALLPRPQYVRFNIDAMVRADLLTRMQAHEIGLRTGLETLDEGRALEDRPPLTESQKSEWLATVKGPPQPAQRESIVVDARSFVTNEPAPAPDVHVLAPHETQVVLTRGAVSVTNEIDATTALVEGSIVANVDARTDVTVPPPPGPVRKRIETDDAGRITAVIEERA